MNALEVRGLCKHYPAFSLREQRDIYFTALLPVPKRAAVRASCVFTVLTELLSLAVLAVTPVMLVCEALPHIPILVWLNDTSAAGNLRQLPLLLTAALLYTAAALLSPSTAARHYEQVDL